MEKKPKKRGEWGKLVEMCLERASSSSESTEKWKSHQAALDRLPFPLGYDLMHRIIQNKLLSPSLLSGFRNSVEELDLSRNNAINEDWLESLGEFHYLSILKLADCKGVNDSSLSHICGLRSLKKLDLSRCENVTDSSIKQLVCIQSLEKLYLAQTKLTENGIIILSFLTNLIFLDLGGIPVTDEALSSLQGLKKLEHLDVRSSEITDNGAKTFESFLRLSFLNVSCTKITFLPFLPSIQTLIMSHCKINSLFQNPHKSKTLSKLVLSWTRFRKHISEIFSSLDPDSLTFLDLSGTHFRDLKFLEEFSNLEHLDLGFSKTTGNMMHSVAKVGLKLKYLNLRKTRVDSYGVYVLAYSVPNLEYLSLDSTSIDDQAFYYISLMSSLITLDLSNNAIYGFHHPNISKLTLYYLQNLKHLENLNLEDTRVGIFSLHQVSWLNNLKSLHLNADFPFEKTLHDLPLNPNLNFLSFCSPCMEDSDLSSFNPPKSLSTLDLRGCQNLTESTVNSFCEIHPQIELIHSIQKKFFPLIYVK